MGYIFAAMLLSKVEQLFFDEFFAFHWPILQTGARFVNERKRGSIMHLPYGQGVPLQANGRFCFLVEKQGVAMSNDLVKVLKVLATIGAVASFILWLNKRG